LLAKIIIMQKNKKRPYSRADDALIVQSMENNPANKKAGYAAAAGKLKRTPAAIEMHFRQIMKIKKLAPIRSKVKNPSLLHWAFRTTDEESALAKASEMDAMATRPGEIVKSPHLRILDIVLDTMTREEKATLVVKLMQDLLA